MSYKTGGTQKGLSLVGFLLNCVLIGFAALVVMRLFPLYSESFKVSAALKSIAEDPDIAQKSAYDIQASLLKRFQIDDVDRFDHNNLKNYLTIKPNGRNGRTMSMTYEDRGPLMGSLDVVLKFDESRAIAGGGSE